MATTKLKGNLVNLGGREVNVGDKAPIVTVTGKDLSDIIVGGACDKVQLIVAVPSLDTGVCAAETRRFNTEAAGIDGVAVTVVSADLPFAMGRFCTTEGIESLAVGSDFRNGEFAQNYGLMIADGPLRGVNARAIFVIGKDGVVSYKELCPEITEEPQYEDAIAAAKAAV